MNAVRMDLSLAGWLSPGVQQSGHRVATEYPAELACPRRWLRGSRVVL